MGLSASVLSPWCAESAASSALPLAEWSFAFGSASVCSPESLSDLCVSALSLSDLCVSASSLVDLVSASFLVVSPSVSLGCSSPSWCAASSSLWDLSDVGLSASVLSPWRAESAASSALPLAEWSFDFGSASARSPESLSDLCVSASSLVDLESASSVLVVCLSSVSLGCSSPSWCAVSSSLWDLFDAGLSASVLSPRCAESAVSSALPLAEWSFALGSASARSAESCPCLASASTLPEPFASPEPWPALLASAASSAWVAGVSAAGFPLCGCLSPPRVSPAGVSFLGVVGASGVPSPPCPVRGVSPWPGVESARETPCVSPVDMPGSARCGPCAGVDEPPWVPESAPT